jgi:hypothetical protein
LVGVEDREPLEERDGTWRFARFFGTPTLVIRDKAIRIDDGDAAFALLDMAAEAKGLSEGEPALASETAFDDGAPEDQHVDPRIIELKRRQDAFAVRTSGIERASAIAARGVAGLLQYRVGREQPANDLIGSRFSGLAAAARLQGFGA